MSLPADPGTPIAEAPHFTWTEMLYSDAAQKYNLDNIPGPEAQKRIIHLATEFLEPLREKFGPIQILSGFRGPELNWFVSLSRHSRHCRGEAADIRLVGGDARLPALIRLVHAEMPFHEMDLHPGPRPWLHLACRIDGPPAGRLLLSQPGLASHKAGLNDLLACLEG